MWYLIYDPGRAEATQCIFSEGPRDNRGVRDSTRSHKSSFPRKRESTRQSRPAVQICLSWTPHFRKSRCRYSPCADGKLPILAASRHGLPLSREWRTNVAAVTSVHVGLWCRGRFVTCPGPGNTTPHNSVEPGGFETGWRFPVGADLRVCPLWSRGPHRTEGAHTGAPLRGNTTPRPRTGRAARGRVWSSNEGGRG